MLIGAISDDLTGGTDLALMFKRAGMSVSQVIGVPEDLGPTALADAVVISLKSRTIPAPDAVAQSLTAARALRGAGARQLFFKYCSTFDSTDEGNIGPVSDALLAETGARWAIVCPAFPGARRTIYQGHLFVGSELLSDSPMRNHPLTPMRDANLVRVLGRQSQNGVGLVPYTVVEKGAKAIRAAFEAEAAAGRKLIVTDALSDAHLVAIGAAQDGALFITGGSGIAMGLPANFGIVAKADPALERLSAPDGRALVLAGSCSEATRGQIRAAEAAGMPAVRLDPFPIAEGGQPASELMAWLGRQPADRPALIYASASPDEVAEAQRRLGTAEAGHLIETRIAEIAREAVAAGTTRFIVAGGETSGAVVAALGVKALAIGPEIAPGVPWTRVVSGPDIVLALKSGNFGQEDFFLRAWDWLA
jgi:uncharacterized protein YgbK (DUF1537 family)